MNTFLNLVKKSLVWGRTRGRVGAFGEVEASSLPTLGLLTGFLVLVNLFSSPARLVGVLTQRLGQAHDLRAIAKV